MTTTPPDDLAALFGLPPPPAPSPSTEAAAEDAEAALAAAEAALAAEIMATIEAGGVAGDAPDSRTDRRVGVSWPARLHLPEGRVVELEVRDVSESGVGLMSGEPVPAGIVVAFEMDVPQPDERGTPTLVTGAIRTTYSIVHGARTLCGGTWQAPPAGADLVTAWIERLRP